MSRLSDLYKAMEILEKEGLPVAENLKIKANELEEEIIKKEVLPIVRDNIEPALQQVKRELVLVVDYIPGIPTSVHLSRKRNLADIISDAKQIVPDPKSEHTSYGNYKVKGTKSAATRLRIEFADGKVIQETYAADTLVKFVQYVGIEKIRSLNIVVSKVPFVSNTLDDKYKSHQKRLGNGWYLMTNTNTETKVKEIEFIASKFHIDLTVSVI